MPRDTLITLTDVKKSYGGRVVAEIPSLTLGQYPIEGLIGPNGAGKTTLMSLITGRISADNGRIVFLDRGTSHDISGMPLDRVARLGLVRTNQRIQDFGSLAIDDSMLLSLAGSREETPFAMFAEKALRAGAAPIIADYLGKLRFSDPGGYAPLGRRKEAARHHPVPAAEAAVPPDG